MAFAPGGDAPGQTVDPAMHHLRSGEMREWDDFPQQAEGQERVVRFSGSKNKSPQTLRLRQRDVKQVWRVRLGQKDLGTLVQDEAEIVHYLAVPAGALVDGDNELRIACDDAKGEASDDVSVGEIELIPRPLPDVVTESSIAIDVVDGGTGEHIPARITIADARGGRVTLGTPSGPTLAVRPGVAYTGDGRADLRLPAGHYTVYAGRGFEYSLALAEVDLAPGARAEKKLTIRRVVPTEGWVACDTHVHTLTYSRHGDATVDERMLTLAGEGIELPIATEHNLQIDYAPPAEKMKVRRYFTPVIGNELTTAARGHFNVFPIEPEKKLIKWQVRDWDAASRAIGEVATDPVVVLNHARDIHGGFRPFDPSRHISLTGEQLDGPPAPANAMEVVNSGATMNDPLMLFRDWFGMLNAGHRLTPVGASDSHDVTRYIVGQGRTYVRCDDSDPGKIDLGQARRSFLEGRVMVSYGLLTTITVNHRFGPGDLVPARGDVDVEVKVLGPEWVKASRVALYANGVEVRSADIPARPANARGDAVQWQGRWTLARPKHDVYLVAMATGPGNAAPYWPSARPYQPTSSHWESYAIGSTGAVWLDADASGRFESAREYAARAVEASGGDPELLATRLEDFDEAVAAQAAAAIRNRLPGEFETAAARVIAAAGPTVRRGLEAYLAQWRQARSETQPQADK